MWTLRVSLMITSFLRRWGGLRAGGLPVYPATPNCPCRMNSNHSTGCLFNTANCCAARQSRRSLRFKLRRVSI
ncbi:hypothetical protein FN846DRAFT_931469 [Sphaerosporella brunnea]|uniref:Secreted protein n=1 Tax=Sphaerosporella brunnea TaxID=1250544 RepID=A0A5J5F7S6_9PEZI|nr:hypothetical protein FN846DRAFT_931469 [Sphaerosporella brunnea]